MNIALIIAGGSGNRTGQDIPKQFINVDNKPIIIYTLEVFQKNSNIDKILVVCIKGWINVLAAYAKQFNITKLETVVEGGNSRFESILNGLRYLELNASDDDIISIHDANRPLVTNEVIDDNINLAHQYGYAVAATPCYDAMYYSEDKKFVVENIEKEKLFRAQCPESIKLKKALNIYKEMEKSGGTDLALTGILIERGEKVMLSKGTQKNFKITTTEDIEMFEAILNTKSNLWMK